jgi:hypothetical protein
MYEHHGPDIHHHPIKSGIVAIFFGVLTKISKINRGNNQNNSFVERDYVISQFLGLTSLLHRRVIVKKIYIFTIALAMLIAFIAIEMVDTMVPKLDQAR